jgi:AraC-like DNA-binding protein
MVRCNIAGVEAVEADTRHIFSRHTHDQFGIGVIDRGAHKSHSGRGMVEAGAGDAITVNPGEVHDGAPIGDAGRSWKILYFDPPLIADAVHDIRGGRAEPCEFSSPVIRDADVTDQFRRLYATMTRQNEPRATMRREELLLMLIAAVISGRTGSTSAQTVPQAVLNARTAIDDDPASHITLADLARECGLSRFQVLRGFVKATGLTPHAYVVQSRINLARRLIARGVPLATAAVSSGFADQSHMTRVFVGKYGMSPRIYANAVS